MKKIFRNLFTHYCAAQAMKSIMSNSKIYNAIVTTHLEQKKYDKELCIPEMVCETAYHYGRIMAKKII